MTTEDIENLLEKFYNAQTTTAEEVALKRYFQSQDVPEALQADKQLFVQLYADAPEEPQGLEARIARNIDGWNMVEKHSNRRARTVSLRWMAGMAASVAVLLTLGTYLNNRESTARPIATDVETYDNPKDAAGETERALTKFSIAINKGLDKINNTETTD